MANGREHQPACHLYPPWTAPSRDPQSNLDPADPSPSSEQAHSFTPSRVGHLDVYFHLCIDPRDQLPFSFRPVRLTYLVILTSCLSQSTLIIASPRHARLAPSAVCVCQALHRSNPPQILRFANDAPQSVPFLHVNVTALQISVEPLSSRLFSRSTCPYSSARRRRGCSVHHPGPEISRNRLT